MLKIVPIPILADNYVWIIKSHHASVYVVDPGESKPVIDYLQSEGLRIEGMLITHSHRDHVGGIDALNDYQTAPVLGPDCPAIYQITQKLYAGNRFKLWNEFDVEVIETPGHLPEHICFLVNNQNDTHLFCGDILFSAGCGRNFVGTSEEFHRSLLKLSQLPPHTQFYCAHEYTLANLKFANHIEPNNKEILEKINKIKVLRAQSRPSLPGNIGEELQINPFMRCHIPAVRQQAENYSGKPLAQDHLIFGALRKWKDSF